MKSPSQNAFEFANTLVKVERHEKYEEKWHVRIPVLQAEYDYHDEGQAELIANGLVVKLAQILDEYENKKGGFREIQIISGTTEGDIDYIISQLQPKQPEAEMDYAALVRDDEREEE